MPAGLVQERQGLPLEHGRAVVGAGRAVADEPAVLVELVVVVEAAAASDEVVIESIDPLKPAVMKATDSGDFLYLLMPVRIA